MSYPMSDQNENPENQIPEAPANDDSGAGAIPEAAKLLETIKSATAEAVQQHNAEAPKRNKGGRPIIHGRYSKVSVGGVGESSGVASVAENPSQGNLPGILHSSKPIDDKTAQAIFDGLIKIIGTAAGLSNKSLAMRELNDKEIAQQAYNDVQLPQEIKELINDPGVECVKEYLAMLPYCKELLVGGGLAAWWWCWKQQRNNILAQGKNLRGNP